MIDPKAIQKAMMLAKSVGRDIGLGRKDVLDRPRRADGGSASNPAGLHQQLFNDFEAAPKSEGIEAAENAWVGNVANLGSKSAAYAVQNMPGYFNYRSHLEDAARKHLGDTFTVYRYMPKKQYEAWKNGDDIGPIGTTLNQNLAKKWGNLATFNKVPQKSHLVSIKAYPESIVMRGHSGEHELVVDANSIDANGVDILNDNYGRPRRADGGYLPPGDPQREANLARYMKGVHPLLLNEDGTPRRLYHGTIKDFSDFNAGYSSGRETGSDSKYSKIKKLGNVHYFTSDPEDASNYAKMAKDRPRMDAEVKRIQEARLAGAKPMQYPEVPEYSMPAQNMSPQQEAEHNILMPKSRMETGANVKPVHLNMKNPLVVDMKGKPGFGTKHITHALENGYDGVILRNAITDNWGKENAKDHYVVFNPTQIKSATGNNGQYDPNEPDINKAEGGAASLPVLPERPPLDVLRRMDAGAKDAWRRDRDVRLGRNYHPPGSPEHDANLMDFMEGAHPLFFKEPGVPRPVYHATNKDIRRFIPGGTAREEDMESGPATWLTFDPTHNPAAHHIGGYKGEYKEGTNVMPLYANIKNPLILNNKDALKAARNKFSIKSNAFPMVLTKDTKNALQEAGHDGIVYQKEAGAFDGDEILAFDNHQLKSALGNRGVYDKQDPTVDYQRGGSITKAEGGTVLSGGFTGPSAIASAPAQRISIPALPTMQSVIGGNSFQMYAPTVASRPDYDHSSVFAPVAAAPSAALQRQYPTATADQLNEYERAIAGGGDPKATRSLMQAYGPASGVKELQPWSSEFKGFDYARSRPVDDFGNPIGWSAPDRTPPTTGVDGVPSGWDARDWENMKNFDPGSPSDEYILNNPWNYGVNTLGGNVMPGEIGTRAAERSSTGPGIAQAQALYESNKKVEAQRQAAMAQNAAALGDPNDYAESYPGSPTQPAYGYTAPWANKPAAQPAAGQTAPKSSWSSLPSNFSLGNLGQMGASILGMTPLGIPITLANSILTGTNTIPQAQTTGSRVLDQAATQGPITNFLAKNVVNPVSQFFGGSPMPKARGGSIFDPDPEKTIRKALMLAYGGATFLPIHGYANGGMPDDPNPRAVIGDNNPPEPMLQPKQDTGDISPKTEPTYSESRVLVRADGPGPNVKGIVVPQHLLDGGKGKNDTWIDGMNVVNKARERVYGSEPRQPLNVGKIAAIHKDILSEHFAKPIEQQMADEKAALQRLRDARHLSKDADTLDKSDKLDTINYETGPNGEKYTAFGSKGIAGHALYHVGNGEYKIVNTCAGATDACSGGVSKEGIVDTLKGNCFAPNAENQYAAAAVKRTCHEQAKHDPAMTSDFILAHTGSLRNAVRVADKQGKHLLFRPNTLDETDRSSVNVIKNLNDQRKLAGLPMIITNAYSKAGDFHDPENGTFRTYSNVGPKVKFGHSVREHYARDNGRIRETISAANPNGSDFANEQGNKTPAKNSYFVTDVPRFSDLDQKMRDSITHVKYWSAGVPVDKLKKELAGEDEEAHYDGSGNLTSPDKSHYGHITYNGRRYDYQRQHVLHPRFVQTGVDSDGKPKLTPTDSRFLDDYFLPEERYMTKNGKKAGAILMTTPTTSTKGAKLYSPFMHHVGDDEIQNALNNNGEYEVDAPRLQEEARGKEYNLDAVLPKRFKKRKADGGAVDHDDFEDGSEEYMSAFPEQSFFAQRHNAHRVTPHEYM